LNADQPVRPGQRIGKYVLGEPIARGGMAEVWSARVEGPEGFVKSLALKFVLESFRGDSELERLFVNEARVAAQLQHANLVSVFDFDKLADPEDASGGRYYIAMERVDGYDLRRVGQDAHRQGRRLPTSVMLHIAGEVLKGLRHVHERRDHESHRPLGLVHRDVSPHNILIGMGGEVKLSDFGIAKAMAQSFGTQSGLIRGKLAYASPEQLRNEPLDHRTDQFALGVTLWEGLAGRRLFDGTDAREIIAKVNNADVPPLPSEAGVDARVEAIVRRMLAAQANARFPSTAEALSAVLSAPGYTPDGAPLAALMAELFAPAPREVPPTLRLSDGQNRGGTARLHAGLAATGLAETKTLDRGPEAVKAGDDRATANDRLGRPSGERPREAREEGKRRVSGAREARGDHRGEGRGQRGTGSGATRAVPVVRQRTPFTVTGSSYVSGAFPDDLLKLVRARPSPRMVLAVIGGVAVVAGVGALVWQGSGDADPPASPDTTAAVRPPPAQDPPSSELDHPDRGSAGPNQAAASVRNGQLTAPDAGSGGPPAADNSERASGAVDDAPAAEPTDSWSPARADEGKRRAALQNGRRRDQTPRASDEQQPPPENSLVGAGASAWQPPAPGRGVAPLSPLSPPPLSPVPPVPSLSVPEKPSLRVEPGPSGVTPNGAPVLQ